MPNSNITKVGKTQQHTQHIEVGSLIEFAIATIPNGAVTGLLQWAKVVNIYNNGLGVFDAQGDATGLTSIGKGSIVVDADIPDNAYVKTIYPAFNRVFSDRERMIITEYIDSKKTFAIHYNENKTSWGIFEPNTSQNFNDVQPINYNVSGNMNELVNLV